MSFHRMMPGAMPGQAHGNLPPPGRRPSPMAQGGGGSPMADVMRARRAAASGGTNQPGHSAHGGPGGPMGAWMGGEGVFKAR